MIEIIAMFLVTALIFYVTFGGADFGAGMLEIFSAPSKKEEVRIAVNKAIGPVWEANHIWIILIVVIIFNALPQAFYTLSVAFHIPLFIMLLGIICRGCAFIFRNYDPYGENSNVIYSKIFAASSMITPFFQGMIAGGLILGSINLKAHTFYEAYITPWLGIFQCSLGFFFCALCVFNASCLLQAENTDAGMTSFLQKRSRVCAGICLILGGLVFCAASVSGLPLTDLYFSNTESLICITLGGLSFLSVIFYIHKFPPALTRIIVAATTSFIIVGWCLVQFPFFVGFPSGSMHSLNIYEIASPPLVLKSLLVALTVGILLILPALLFMFKVFKSEKN